MKRFALKLMLASLIFIPGCVVINDPTTQQTTTSQQQTDAVAQLHLWLQQQEYSKALDMLASLDKAHPQYDKLIKQKPGIEKAMHRFELDTIADIRGRIKSREWHNAEKAINNALRKLPDSPLLHQVNVEFVKQRAQYLKNLYYQFYINKAEWLVKNKEVQRELSRTLPDQDKAQYSLEQYQLEADQVYQQLVICGIEATNIGDIELAEQCFSLAYELKPTTAMKNSLQDIQLKLSRNKLPIQSKLSVQGRTFLDESKNAMQAGKLKQALLVYQSISPADQKHPLVSAYKQELDKRIRLNVANRIEQGRKLYSQEEIKQALAVWKQAYELAPDNKALQNHIERAEKVMQKITRLKQQKATVKPPSTDTIKAK